LLGVPSFPTLAVTNLLAQLGGNAWELVLILFVLERFHSPALAGLAAFCGLAPGLAISPLAGALLDRFPRGRLIAFDLGVGAVTAGLLVVLAAGGRLSPFILLAVISVSSLAVPLSSGGFRTLVPVLVPRPLWDRANALIVSMGNVALLIGPALAGVLVATMGGLVALLAIGWIWLAGAILALLIREPAPAEPASAHIMRSAWQGVRYLLSNPTLRGLSIILPTTNIGYGAFVVALPVLVLRLHAGAAQVGLLWSVFAAAALIAGLLFGHIRSEGRERSIMAATLALYAGAFFVAAMAARTPFPLALLAVAMALAGCADGPLFVTMISYRQRATDPEQLGRALSISGSISYLGVPMGSALAGASIGLSLTGTMVGAALLAAVCVPLTFVLLPASSPQT